MNKSNENKKNMEITLENFDLRPFKIVEWTEKKGNREKTKATSKMLIKISMKWHKYNYAKYQYLEAGCINEKIKTDLRQKKIYHYGKQATLALLLQEQQAIQAL